MKCIECNEDAAASISDENESHVHMKYYCSEHYWDYYRGAR